MFVEFNKLPGNARIWIYQSKRELAKKEAEAWGTNKGFISYII